MSQFIEQIRNQTGLSDDEIREIGRSINIRSIDKQGEVERVLEAANSRLGGSADLYAQIRDQTGLNNSQIRDLAQSVNIRNIDKPGEVTRIVEAHNTVNPTVPNQEPEPSTGSPGTSQSDYDTLLADYEELQSSYGQNISDAVNTAIGGYEDRISGMRTDFERQLDDYRGEMQANTQRFQDQYQAAMDQQTQMRDEYEGRLKDQETDFLEQLDARNRQEADAQLASVRAGSTQAATSSAQGPASLTSGQTSASKADKGSVMDVRPEVNATDSVLDRSGPVVQLINRSAQRRPSGGGRSPLAGGSGASYYASRFG